MVEGTGDDGEIMSVNDMEVGCLSMKTSNVDGLGSSYNLDKEQPMNIGPLSELSKSSMADVAEHRGTKRPNNGEVEADIKKCRTDTIGSDDEAEAVENKLVWNMDTIEHQSKIKEGSDTCFADCVPLQHPDENFCCTACDKVALEVHAHPLLKVIICRDCYSLMEEKIRLKVWMYSYYCI